MSGIQEFVSSMSKARGFARTSKYAVVITPPSSLKALMFESNVTTERIHGPTMMPWEKQVGKQINLHCNSVSMPGHDMQAQDVQHGSAPGRQMVPSHDYNGTIAASFYLDSHLRERLFFEQWQKMIVNKSTHKAYYYDDYIGSMEIFQLDGNGEITYGIKATEVYPTTIAGIEYAYGNTNQIATQSVNFQYRQWFNMTNDAIEGYSDTIRLLDLQRQKEIDEHRAQLAQNSKMVSQTTAKAHREADSLRHLRPPEVDVDRHDVNRRRLERLERLKKPEVDLQGRNMRSAQIERARQKHLKKPEIDRQDRNMRSAQIEIARQKHLRSPTRK